MTNEEILEAMETAIYAVYDVKVELKTRQWSTHDARRLLTNMEDFRDGLKGYLRQEAAHASR